MSTSLIEYETIKTTVSKAKEVRSFVERLVTIAKTDSVSKRRIVFSRIRSKDAVSKLFNDIGPRFKNRPGGYLRIVRCRFRNGDKTDMALIQFVDTKINSEES